jgi:hypothetical protein
MPIAPQVWLYASMSDGLSSGWKQAIFEDLGHPGVVSKASSRGYLDYKHLLYGNQHDGSLSLQIHVQQSGYIYLCEGARLVGKLLTTFVHLWESSVEIYQTPLSQGEGGSKLDRFEFKKGILVLSQHRLNSSRSRYQTHSPLPQAR